MATANLPMGPRRLVAGQQDVAKGLLALEDVEESVVDPIVHVLADER